MAEGQAESNSGRGHNPGPPYAPQVWQYGGKPGIVPDVPICATYIFCYLIAAVIHKTIFLVNKNKKGKKFVMSAMTFGFCCVRILTFSLRLSWAVQPSNLRLALVSNIFLNAGIPILYIINLVFSQRIIRAQHPRLGWHRSLSVIGRILLVLIVLTLVMLIYAGVQQAYTLDPSLHRITRDIQIYGSTFNCSIAFLPLPMVLIGLILPRRVRTEKFGDGHFKVKILVLVISALMLSLRAVWATTTTWLQPISVSDGSIPWYYQKTAFYTVQLFTELIVIYMFIFVRIDRRFYTPDGISRGSYLTLHNASMTGHPPPYSTLTNFPTTTTLHVYSDDELFDDERALANTLHYSSTSLLLDSASGKWQLQRHSLNDIYSPSNYTGSDNGTVSRGSMGSYCCTPVAASAETSKTPSINTPSTWNRDRWNKGKEKRDADSIRNIESRGRPSLRWSAPVKEKDAAKIKLVDLHRPNEKRNLRWSTPAKFNAPTREQMAEAKMRAVEAEARRNTEENRSRTRSMFELPQQVNTPALRMSSTPTIVNALVPHVQTIPPERTARRSERLVSTRYSFQEIWE